ncbi:hypothetical protein C8R43DRAFT_1126596 [Mycena crocata]|nr:hypothetical protein C8R43DRAFT_1126596 [Mycena crocata]
MFLLSCAPTDDNMPPSTPTRSQASIASHGGTLPNTAGSTPARMVFSLQQLDPELHLIQLESRAKEQSNKGTSKSYLRQIASYQAWWDASETVQILQDPRLVAIPAFPVTAAKVAMFLQYETTHEKKKCGTTETVAGTSVGKSQISHVISAL